MWVLTVRVQMFRNRVIDLYDVIIFGKSKHHNYKGEFSLSNSKNIEKKETVSIKISDIYFYHRARIFRPSINDRCSLKVIMN